MDDKKLKSMLILIVPQVIQLVINNYKVTDIEATEMIYKSELYSLLEDEETKLWHFSPLTLFNMFDEERITGRITFPEEA